MKINSSTGTINVYSTDIANIKLCRQSQRTDVESTAAKLLGLCGPVHFITSPGDLNSNVSNACHIWSDWSNSGCEANYKSLSLDLHISIFNMTENVAENVETILKRIVEAVAPYEQAIPSINIRGCVL